jgi:ADP-ribosylglycohydrolase
MRIAPVGLIHHDSHKSVFDNGVKIAALTHGHPDGYLPAGVLATIIASINNGNDLMPAIEDSLIELRKYKRHESTERAIVKAIRLYNTQEPTFENVEKLGGGWVGEEALSIALFCALHYQTDFEKAIILAINHSGDTDSTGSITGNILGLLLGKSAIPILWLNNLNMKSIISDMATQLYSENKEEVF